MSTGIFENSSDIGTILHPGSSSFDAGSHGYTLSGSGENMWGTRDAFHYVWNKAEGDVALTADVCFIGKGVDPHRKACLVVRESLAADSPYADIALHGDGLTSLQFRQTRGGVTQEIQSNIVGPTRLRLEKRGAYILMFLAGADGDLSFAGPAVRLAFSGPFYIGLGVCSHNKDVSEKAVFTNVRLSIPAPLSVNPKLYSVLETQILSSTDRRVVHVTPTHIEAPNWLSDGQTLIYNSNGRIHRIPAAGGVPTLIDTGFATRCNNDHGLTPDGKTLIISDQSQGGTGGWGTSLIYTLPIEGGTPKLVTENGPSYWHGVSPDGRTLTYCAQRDGKYGIFTIPIGGGGETRLTTAESLDDGPEYSPDGKCIYFNSDRTGRMQIWRMSPDGSGQEQVTFDEFNNWFAHPSPDGRTLVYLAYGLDVQGHPANQDVSLRRLDLASGRVDTLANLFGGQGTINVPCWSPDGRKIAFVSYQLLM